MEQIIEGRLVHSSVGELAGQTYGTLSIKDSEGKTHQVRYDGEHQIPERNSLVSARVEGTSILKLVHLSVIQPPARADEKTMTELKEEGKLVEEENKRISALMGTAMTVFLFATIASYYFGNLIGVIMFAACMFIALLVGYYYRFR